MFTFDFLQIFCSKCLFWYASLWSTMRLTRWRQKRVLYIWTACNLGWWTRCYWTVRFHNKYILSIDAILLSKMLVIWVATTSISETMGYYSVSIIRLQKLLCHVYFLNCFFIYVFPLIFQCVNFRSAGMYYVRMVADPDKRVNIISYWPWKTFENNQVFRSCWMLEALVKK